MEYRKFGNSGFDVSRIVLGCWGIGSDFYGKVEMDQIIDTVHAAVDGGINLVDTAPNYGNSEEVLGIALKGIRDKVYIATKCGNIKYAGGSYKLLTPVSMRIQLEESLKRLQTDYIDLYQIHCPDKNNSLETAYEVMNEFVKEGKIRAWGVCNHNTQEALMASDAGAVSVQQIYSLTRKSAARDVIPVSSNAGMAVEVYGTLSGGLLTGKYKEAKTIGTVDRRPMFYSEFKEENWKRSQKVLSIVEEVAEAHDTAMSKIAIAWTLANPLVTCALVGAKTAKQVQANIDAAHINLTEDDMKKLNAIEY